jgi:phosphoribosylamine--glycine ligase
MRFLGVGDACELGALYVSLVREGHDVKVDIADPLCHGTLAGLVERTKDWRRELDWVGRDGIILFENVAKSRGAVQDHLRESGYRVIGGSAFGDKLETDRAYAQRVLAELGLSVCRTHEFPDAAAALAQLDVHPRRVVLKFNDPEPMLKNYVGWFADGADVKAILSRLPHAAARRSLVLMDHIEGIEMGVGAYFDGDKFLTPACLDWEHKHFFPDDQGELTGEMGTVVTYSRSQHFFEMTLKKTEALLRRHRYCGYINLNTIVNERGIWPLEFTCRFGYPGFAILAPLQNIGWADLFRAMIARSSASFDVLPGFCVGMVLTTPPFPYERSQVDEPVGLPVMFDGPLSEEDKRHIHYGEVGLDEGSLVTSGTSGWTMVVTGVGATVPVARSNALNLAKRVRVPNLRYRQDIGEKLIRGDLAKLEQLGLFGRGEARGVLRSERTPVHTGTDGLL